MMSSAEIQGLAQRFADAFSNKDVEAVVGMLAEDVEIFDHVPYRFDDKAQGPVANHRAPRFLPAMRHRPEDGVEDEAADLLTERLPGVLVVAEVLAGIDAARRRLVGGL
jgi:hypothetical protein